VSAIANLSEQRREARAQARRRTRDEEVTPWVLNTLSSFPAEVVEEGIPAAIEDGGLRLGVLSVGTTGPTSGIIADFRSAIQKRPAGYGHGTNTSVARRSDDTGVTSVDQTDAGCARWKGDV
jgi:hypothetical protein